MRRKLLTWVVVIGLVFLCLFALIPSARAECGIFEFRLTPMGAWEMRVGCDGYTSWLRPQSIYFDQNAYYWHGLIFDDGSFVQHHVTGCLAEYGCRPDASGVPIYDPEGDLVQYKGYWVVYVPLLNR